MEVSLELLDDFANVSHVLDSLCLSFAFLYSFSCLPVASSTCDCLLCEPAWLVPLATTGLEHHIPVSVNQPGMEQYVTPLRTLLYLDTLSQQAQLNASNLDTVFQELASGRTFPLPYLPHLSSSMALGGFTHQNIIIISNDEFRNYVSLKALNDSFDSSMMSVTSLRESYLLLTSVCIKN
ncbi:uncharacterized protein LOC106161332 [Lingula anatina]|uniref:Uncharacterized protein LOC106161332 n=1 Tax=Lingula anatina TaxID=7574 RepID=A0A1S3I617_LINAN|nr:uncharacterized protein LOC106161332 [Lingula anatina]|eukprot:XP_013393720.2 uncharacterized protein LOC106161332 [Lingula anatina]